MWYYAKNQVQMGPYDESAMNSRIRQGEITPKILVWKEGMNNWIEAQSSVLGRYFHSTQEEKTELRKPDPTPKPTEPKIVYEREPAPKPEEPKVIYERQPEQRPIEHIIINQNSSTYPPVSIGEWIGMFFVLLIPLIGIIMYFVWAFSSSTNPSKSNYIKAQMLIYLISIGLAVIITAMLGSSIFSMIGDLFG